MGYILLTHTCTGMTESDIEALMLATAVPLPKLTTPTGEGNEGDTVHTKDATKHTRTTSTTNNMQPGNDQDDGSDDDDDDGFPGMDLFGDGAASGGDEDIGTGVGKIHKEALAGWIAQAAGVGGAGATRAGRKKGVRG